MKITVAGAGYVGLANAVLLAQKYPVTIYDIDRSKIELLKDGISPLADAGIEAVLNSNELRLHATDSSEEAYSDVDFVIIATPTDFISNSNCFNTTSVEDVVQQVSKHSPRAIKIIRSTMPIGYTQTLMKTLNDERYIVMPEFLREGRALHDSKNPSRIVVGVASSNIELLKSAKEFVDYMLNCIEVNPTSVPVLYMEPSEAEATKLFSNAYLASRVAFFNEIDTFACLSDYNASRIIEGVSLDPRIGNYYNNPSFGYGGYCLPKDTELLSTIFQSIPNALINAIVRANATRKMFIAEDILQREFKTAGIYRLTMKSNSDNYRHSAIHDVIELLENHGKEILIYEPTLDPDESYKYKAISNLNEFKAASDIIVANRYDMELDDVIDKVYTRDLFNEN